jgi:hypothetical protein
MDAIVSGLKYGSVPIPVVDTFMKFFLNANQAVSSKNEYKKVVGLRKALVAIAALSGIPGTAQIGQAAAWAHNPKTLTFPYNAELKDIEDKGAYATYGEKMRAQNLRQAKSQFQAYATKYRNAMTKSDIGVAAIAADKAAETLGGL